MAPPAQSMVPWALVERPPGQMESCTREGVWGNAHWFDVAFHVSDLFLVRPTLPSTSHVIWSGVHWISYSWKSLYESPSMVMFPELTSGGS